MSSNTSPEPSTGQRATAESAPASGERVPRVDVETTVPADGAVHRCAYCDRPFAVESYLVLHRGLAHPTALSDEERAAFEAAYDEERAALNRFRIVALGVLVVLYFGFLFAFAVVT